MGLHLGGLLELWNNEIGKNRFDGGKRLHFSLAHFNTHVPHSLDGLLTLTWNEAQLGMLEALY